MIVIVIVIVIVIDCTLSLNVTVEVTLVPLYHIQDTVLTHVHCVHLVSASHHCGHMYITRMDHRHSIFGYRR